MTFDLVIRNGTVVDGTGAPGRVADVAISDGVVTHVGGDDGATVDGPARQEIDADGAHLAEAGVQRPNTTWTYLVNDNPFSSGLEETFKGLVKLVRRR